MIRAVAARYSFSAAEIKAMKLSEIAWWYEGHLVMYEEEKQAQIEAMNGALGGSGE